MSIKQITIKTTAKALRMLRLIAAHTGERQYAVLERLLQKELQRVENTRKKEEGC
jgi:hypothetical protein